MCVNLYLRTYGYFSNVSVCQYIYLNITSAEVSRMSCCPVGWGCRIHRLHLCRGVTPSPISVLDMKLNNLMVRSQ